MFILGGITVEIEPSIEHIHLVLFIPSSSLFWNVLKQLYGLKIHKDVSKFVMNDIVNLIFIELDE